MSSISLRMVACCLVLVALLGAPVVAGDSERVKPITFDDLKFPIEKDQAFKPEMITESIHALDGKPIRLRGFILPASVFTLKGIKEFVLVRDNLECCFGPGAALYDCVIVRMAKGQTATFTSQPVAVEGRFRIETLENPDKPDHPLAVFEITGMKVE